MHIDHVLILAVIIAYFVGGDSIIIGGDSIQHQNLGVVLQLSGCDYQYRLNFDTTPVIDTSSLTSSIEVSSILVSVSPITIYCLNLVVFIVFDF